jgi:hypothetical protein
MTVKVLRGASRLQQHTPLSPTDTPSEQPSTVTSSTSNAYLELLFYDCFGLTIQKSTQIPLSKKTFN